MTMIEKMARAICEVDCGRVTENELARCRDLAAVALTALQETSDGMVGAGAGSIIETPVFSAEIDATDVFRAMIRAAIDEGEG